MNTPDNNNANPNGAQVPPKDEAEKLERGTSQPAAGAPAAPAIPWYTQAANWIEEHPVTVLGTICAIGITAECIILATRKQS